MTVPPESPTAEPARCPRCGREVDLTDTACRYCGAGLPMAATVATPPDAQPQTTPGAAEVLAEELRGALAPGIQLLRPLGEGGMGHVWLARDPALKRHVAVKVLHPELANDPASRARFAREAEAAAAVAHPGVVNVYQVGELPRSGTTYFVMQYVEGKSLQEEIKAGEAMPEARVRRIVGETASALAAAHARGLVHRDIKPANVMLDSGSGRVVVLDFGISAALERRGSPAATRLTAEGHSIGTPMYMSPEQAAAQEVTPKSDVYSLGVLAFELATGRPPFAGETAMELAAAHIKDVPPKVSALRPDLEPRLAGLIDRCLAKAPRDRPAAADIARALHPEAHAVIEWPPPGLEPLRGQGAELAAVMGLGAGVGLLFFLILRAQPILLMPGWYVERFMAFDGTPIWYFALGMCLVTLLIVLPLVAMRAWHIAGRLGGARRSGYPWAVLLDVAWDQRDDTGSLLNGLGAYALVETSERRRIMALRRRQAAWAAATIVLAVVSPLSWLAGWTGGWAGNIGPVMPGPEVLAVFLPVLVGLAGLAWSARPEARLHQRLGHTREPRRDEGTVRSELVAAWLVAAGRAAGGAARRVPRLALVAVPTLLTLVLVAGSAIVMAVAFSVSRALIPARESGRALIRTMRTDSLRPMAWQQFDSIVAASARLPDPSVLPDLPALVAGRQYLVPERNDSLAAAAIARGDKVEAQARVRENIAIGRSMLSNLSFLQSGSITFSVWGRRIIEKGARRLVELGHVTADPVIAAEGERLKSAMHRVFVVHWFIGTRALMADPSGGGLMGYLRDTTLAPDMRVFGTQAIVYGFCLNTREVLFGVDPRRRTTLRQAEAALRDIPGAAVWLGRFRGDLEALIHNPATAEHLAVTPVPVLRHLGWIGLSGVRDRLAICRALPY